jgi:hypothetical protein
VGFRHEHRQTRAVQSQWSGHLCSGSWWPDCSPLIWNKLFCIVLPSIDWQADIAQDGQTYRAQDDLAKRGHVVYSYTKD